MNNTITNYTMTVFITFCIIITSLFIIYSIFLHNYLDNEKIHNEKLQQYEVIEIKEL